MPKQTFFNLPKKKRQNIIELALEEFASHPYSKASLSNIVARAGISKGSMYQYFEDKKDLFIYLIDLAGKEKMAFIQKHGVDRETNFFTALEQMLLAATHFSFNHPQLAKIMANALEPSAEPVLLEINARWKPVSLQFFKEMLYKGQNENVIRKDIDVRLIAHLLMVLLNGGLTDYFMDVLGVNLFEFLSNPDLAKKFSEEDIRSIIKNVISFLRLGLQDGGGCNAENHLD